MSEIVRRWIENMLDKEITEVLGAIDNERLWQKGSDSQEEIDMHEDNILNHEEYLEWLKAKLEEINK